jgi:nitrate/nitrite transport system ATP-binding protein
VVFQNHSLLPWLTVYENVNLAVNEGVRGEEVARPSAHWIMHNLDLVQMGHAKRQAAGEISGGMKQRVGIAGRWRWNPRSCCSTSRSARSTP